jgi:hypothetical protein
MSYFFLTLEVRKRKEEIRILNKALGYSTSDFSRTTDHYLTII